jgi:hypothetical protein
MSVRPCIKVEVFGETIIDGKLAGTVHGDESTWCLVGRCRLTPG